MFHVEREILVDIFPAQIDTGSSALISCFTLSADAKALPQQGHGAFQTMESEFGRLDGSYEPST
jgi:hypothetical protein